jgi:hypothetical protein
MTRTDGPLLPAAFSADPMALTKIGKGSPFAVSAIPGGSRKVQDFVQSDQ